MAESLDQIATAPSRQPLIVVAGFGAAGATAAIAAAQTGARVLVCERASRPERGGNTRKNLFYMALDANGNPSQELLSMLPGTTAPWSSRFGETAETAKFWGLDSAFVKAWIEEALPAVEWMKSLGFEFAYAESDVIDDGFAPGLLPVGGGDAMLDTMEAIALDLGVELAFETALVGVDLNADGAVDSIQIDTPQGRKRVPCDSVIMATGGFHGNHELMSRYLGPNARHAVPLTRFGFHNRGEGLRIALDLGGATAGDLSDWHGLTMDARADGERWIVGGMEIGILVNRFGDRFHDEATGEPAEKAVRDQDGGFGFYVADARLMRHPFADRRFNTRAEPLRAESIDELATLMGVPAARLSQTVAEYNAHCGDGSAGTIGLRIEKSSGAKPLDEAPFLAWPVRAGICFSLGGVKTDEHGQVLTENANPIVGLYAVGDTGGGYFNGYVNYSSSIKAIVFGRRSAAHAAARSTNRNGPAV